MEDCPWLQSSYFPTDQWVPRKIWALGSNATDLKVGNWGEARSNDLISGPQHVSEVKEAHVPGTTK